MTTSNTKEMTLLGMTEKELAVAVCRYARVEGVKPDPTLKSVIQIISWWRIRFRHMPLEMQFEGIQQESDHQWSIDAFLNAANCLYGNLSYANSSRN